MPLKIIIVYNQEKCILRNNSHLLKRLGLDHDDHTEEK